MTRLPLPLLFVLLAPAALFAQQPPRPEPGDEPAPDHAPAPVPEENDLRRRLRGGADELRRLAREGRETLEGAVDGPRDAFEQARGRLEDAVAAVQERAHARLDAAADRLDAAWPPDRRGPLLSDEDFIPAPLRDAVHRDGGTIAGDWDLHAELSGLEVTALHADMDFHAIAAALARLDFEAVEYRFVLLRVNGLTLQADARRGERVAVAARVAVGQIDASIGKPAGRLGLVGRAEAVAGEAEARAALGPLSVDAGASYGIGPFFDWHPTRWFRWLKTGMRMPGAHVSVGLHLRAP